MASSLSVIAAKDGNGTLVTGGLLAVDKSGAGTGPFFAVTVLGDTQGVNTATVKAANTAPVAGDTSLVVAINPNSQNANGQASNANGAPVTVSNQQTFAGQNQALPLNQFVMGGMFVTTPTIITSGNASPLQMDNAGNLLVNVKVGGSSGTVAQGSTTSGQSGNLIQGAVTTSAPSYTTAQTSPLSLDTSGNLRVNVVAGGGGVVTNAGTFAVQESNIVLAEAPVAPATAIATKSLLMGGQYNSPDIAFTNGQQGQVSIDQRGGLYVQDGQQIAPVSVTSATTLFAISNTSGYGSVSVQVTSAGTTCTITYESSEDGTTWTPTAGYLPSNVGNVIPVTITTAVQNIWFPLISKQFRARVSTYTSGTVTVQATMRKDPLGKIATAGVVNGSINDGSGVGAVSIQTSFEARTTNKTAVTTGTNVRPIATTVGAQVNRPYQVPELDWDFVAASGGIVNTTTAVTMATGPAAGLRNYCTGLQIYAGTLGAATEVVVRDGAAGTVIWRGFVPTAGNNYNIYFPTPIKGSLTNLLEVVTLTATVTGGVYVNAQGYVAP